jgi:hypothetical protein
MHPLSSTERGKKKQESQCNTRHKENRNKEGEKILLKMNIEE